MLVNNLLEKANKLMFQTKSIFKKPNKFLGLIWVQKKTSAEKKTI